MKHRGMDNLARGGAEVRRLLSVAAALAVLWAAPLSANPYTLTPAGAIDLYFVPDDDGRGEGTRAECKEKNNLMHVRTQCPGDVE